jgi:hypothetical protein
MEDKLSARNEHDRSVLVVHNCMYSLPLKNEAWLHHIPLLTYSLEQSSS